MTAPQQVAPGVPALPWRLRLHCDDVKHYEGHAFITADPKGLGRSVCDGFVDDMAWIAQMHNALIIVGWRVRLARRLLRLTAPHIIPPESASTLLQYDGSGGDDA